jgi:Tfp pilus assembly protein PilZ
MADKRACKRIIKRLEAEVSAEGKTLRCITGNMTDKGIFIRTTRGFPIGTHVDVTLCLPDGKEARLRGVVTRTVKPRPLTAKPNPANTKEGMGVAILESDENYMNLMKRHNC